MRAIIIRHRKVDFKWEKLSTSEQFNEDCKMYDKAPILPLCTDILKINDHIIYISSLSRSRDTARQLFGKQAFVTTKLIDEVPLCACVAANIKLPLIFWNVVGRLQWLFNMETQEEGRAETVQRAQQFVEMIVETDQDCIIVTHGFFMHTLINMMKKYDFHFNRTQVRYSNGEYILAKR